jgi:hypothetical protein
MSSSRRRPWIAARERNLVRNDLDDGVFDEIEPQSSGVTVRLH